jgi:NADH-quinone oxidoreductase subunit N
MIFLSVELLSLALYVLSGFARGEERSQEAGLKYLLLGGFASGFLLYGMALVYGETGHTQLTLIQSAIAHSRGGIDALLVVGVVLIFAGLAFKVSAAPFHAWTPDVYQGAPTSVTAFMSVSTKVAAFASILRVFTYALPDLLNQWRGIVAVVAIVSMLVGNLGALAQHSIKRLLAYSGIAQAGYMLIGIAALSSPATQGPTATAVLFFMGAYAVTNIGAFAVITVTAGRGEDLDDYSGLRGLAQRRPYAAAAMSLFLLSLAGFPPTVGFFGKFFVFAAAIQAHHAELAFWGIATSAVSVFYYLRVIVLMYGKPETETGTYRWGRVSAAGGMALVLTAAATVGLGVAASGMYGWATDAHNDHVFTLVDTSGTGVN